MNDEADFLRNILDNPQDRQRQLVYADWLMERDGNRDDDKARRIRAIREPLPVYGLGTYSSGYTYFEAGYLFGGFGAETNHQPGDPIPQAWPETPFANRYNQRATFDQPWYKFWYCLLLGQYEDCIGHLWDFEYGDGPGLPLPAKPCSLDIVIKNNVMIGRDPAGNDWLISWCGNGQYSHWVLTWRRNPKVGWYVYAYPEGSEQDLKQQIMAAEKKHGYYGKVIAKDTDGKTHRTW